MRTAEEFLSFLIEDLDAQGFSLLNEKALPIDAQAYLEDAFEEFEKMEAQ